MREKRLAAQIVSASCLSASLAVWSGGNGSLAQGIHIMFVNSRSQLGY